MHTQTQQYIKALLAVCTLMFRLLEFEIGEEVDEWLISSTFLAFAKIASILSSKIINSPS